MLTGRPSDRPSGTVASHPRGNPLRTSCQTVCPVQSSPRGYAGAADMITGFAAVLLATSSIIAYHAVSLLLLYNNHSDINPYAEVLCWTTGAHGMFKCVVLGRQYASYYHQTCMPFNTRQVPTATILLLLKRKLPRNYQERLKAQTNSYHSGKYIEDKALRRFTSPAKTILLLDATFPYVK